MSQENKKINSNISELSITKTILKNSVCSKCQQKFTADEIDDKNFTLFFKEDNIERAEINTIDKRDGRFTLWIADITHQQINNWNDCPETGNCAGCDGKIKEADLKKAIACDDFYCSPCFNEKYKDYLKERSKEKKLSQEQKEIGQIIQKVLDEHLNSEYHNIPGNGHYGICKGSKCEGFKATLKSYGYDWEK